MRICVIILLALVLFVGSFGCQAIKFSRTPPPEEAAVIDEPVPEALPLAQELFESAKALFVDAQDLIEAGELAQAKDLLDKAITLCLTEYDATSAPEQTVRLDSLFIEICVAQVRIGHMRGVFVTSLPEESELGLEYNPDVERWLSYFLTNGRRSMEIYLSRSGKYVPMIDRILKENDLPLDLKYLAMIESGYSPYAYSSASAVGLWQFIKSTGKHYNLKIDSWVDERRDPEKATRAAADYLGTLHSMFNSWPLAMASYNCGEGAVQRAIKRNSTRDYWQLDLPTETCNYVPKFYAALIIARDPELYGFFVAYEDPLEYETVVLDRPADMKKLAEVTGVSYEELKDLNPELLSQYTHPKVVSYALKVPKARHTEFKEAFAAASDSAKYLSKSQLAKLKTPKSRGKVVYYKVRKGDTLSTIAKKFHTTVRNIKKWNRSARGKYIKPGMKLKIYRGKR